MAQCSLLRLGSRGLNDLMVLDSAAARYRGIQGMCAKVAHGCTIRPFSRLAPSFQGLEE